MGPKKLKSREPQTSKEPTSKAIISPWIDFLCCGGLSIFVVLALFVGLFFLRWVNPESPYLNARVSFEDILILGFLVNFPHFMASYRILYRQKKQIQDHQWASIFVPLILLALIGYALLTPSTDPDNPEFANGSVVELVTLSAGILLAWHYTGQGWGMTAAFSFIGGIRMESRERTMIRAGYYALMVLHILWAVLVASATPDDYLLFSSMLGSHLRTIEFAFMSWWVVVLATIPIGIIGFLNVRKRTGSNIPARAIAPWVSIYMWYALISVYPGLFPILQIFHALQYLIFPIRVEMNQHAKSEDVTLAKKANWSRGLIYYFVLVFIGVVVFTSPGLAMWINEPAFLAINALLLGFINIHHYFIDGAIWKIRNPDVRRDLFAHLQP